MFHISLTFELSGLGIAPIANLRLLLSQNLEDEELLKISQQIGSHMDSMQGNLRQVDGILPAMEITKAALHDVLLKQLDSTKCEEVLLG